MKYTKRVVSLFIIATMILSMLSAFIAVPVMAITAPEVLDTEGGVNIEGDLFFPIQYGDELWVEGTDITAGEAVNIYWDFVQSAYLLNTTTAENDGTYGCYITVPAAYNGSHYIWAKDIASGLSMRSADLINVWSYIELDPDAGLSGDECTVSGYGFEADEDIEIAIYDVLATPQGYDEYLVILADEEETDDDGSFSIDVDIPSAWPDGTYTFNATGGGLTNATATYSIGPAVILDITEGPAGTIVKVDGRGFGSGATIEIKDDIRIDDGVTDYQVWTRNGDDITTGTGSSAGKFTAYIVIPGVPVDDYEIIFTDDTAKSASDDFEVIGETEIEISPSYGTPGTVLTVTGYNYTQVSGTDVELTIESQTAEASTDANGEFTATITIPPLDFGERYDVWAKDTKGCNASEEVLVALIVLQLSDYSAPVGSRITLMGSGFSIGGDWNATLGDLDIIETQTITAGKTYFSRDFYVPSLPSGTYTIGVLDVDEEIEVGIDFTVTDQAALSVNRVDVPNGYNLTIDGIHFMEEEDQVTEWWLFNSTDEWDITANVTYGSPGGFPTTDEDGAFIGYYEVTKFLVLGSYTINCTTESNDQVDPEVTQSAEVDIEIVPEEVVLNVGNPSYARGQTITFVIKATLKKDPFYLGIKDPEGSEVFNGTWDTDLPNTPDSYWATIGAWFYIPSNRQIDVSIGDTYTVPADALPGTWTYVFWDDNKVYATGSFEVTELTEIEQLQQDISGVASGVLELGTSVTDLATSLTAVSGAAAEAAAAAATAAAAAADAKAAADSAADAISDVGDTAEDALDAANDAKSAADAAKTAADSGLAAANDAKATAQAAADAATDAKDAAETTQQQTSGLTTLVYGAIGASLIAALAAIVSLMQISRRIAG